MSNMYGKFNHTLYNMFKQQVQKTPFNLAVIYENINETVNLTYQQLYILVDIVAKKIEDLSFKEQVRIGVYGERNIYTLISILAIFKSGNIYVPLDISYPEQYLETIVKEAEIKLVLKNLDTLTLKFEDEINVISLTNIYLETAGNDVNYKELASDKSSLERVSLIMYTSGSTGNPKGVVHKQYQLLNRFKWMWTNYPFNSEDRICQRTNVNFMPSMWEFLGGLLQGIPTVIIASSLVKDPLRLIEVLNKQKVTYLLLVPSLLKRMLESSEGIVNLKKIRLWMTAGEPLSIELLKEFKKCLPEALLLNDYGSTEINGVLYFDTKNFNPNLDSLPKFKSIDNITTYVLDDNLKQCKSGEVGELYIGGISLAMEYLNLPEESRRKFIVNPFGDGSNKIYRTEDLVKCDEEGNFEILGRKDLQVKINGIRMEIGAIEKVILENDTVKECVIFPKEVTEGVKKLFAYLVEQEEGSLDDNELRKFIGERLPYYMIPSHFVKLKELPRLPNGKIDRQLLLEININSKNDKANFIIDKDGFDELKLKEQLINIAAYVLGIEYKDINTNDEFNSIGFDSLTIVDFLNNINKKYNIKIKVSDLFDYCTINKLTEYLTKNKLLLHEDLGYDTENKEFITNSESDKIAIIGMSGRFPGADNVYEFWGNLKNGVNSIKEVPKERWDIDEYYDSNVRQPFKTISRWGGFIDCIEEFDAEFFNISPRESIYMDPQQRLLLQEGWKSLEDAGYCDKDLNNKSVGIYLGARNGDYNNLIERNNIPVDPYTALGCDLSILPARISYYLNLKGPCMAIDTACSSSLVAIHLACNSIRNRECEMALAGGVSLMCSPEEFVRSSKLGLLSKDGKCKTFDNNADGIALGEGIGVVVLKSLDKAIQDKDRIYGVICGSGVNQDGKTNGITAPSSISQFQLIKDTYEKYCIDASKINYVECHGTGTKLGDPIEVNALVKAFRLYSSQNNYCALASVKTNIGHTVACSGVAGLIKILMSMSHGKIAPTLNYNEINEHLNISDSPFFINENLRDWDEPRMAAINSFGLSGTNCHMVIEEFKCKKRKQDKVDSAYFIIPISAKSKEAINNKVKDLKKWLMEESNNSSIQDIAYTLQKGRSHFKYRLALIIKDKDELIEKLENSVNQIDNLLIFSNLENEVDLVKEDLSILPKATKEILEDSDIYLSILRKIAINYVLGEDIEWKKYYISKDNEIISMPVYPFQRKRFWINDNIPKIKETNANSTNHKNNEGILSLKIMKNDRIIKDHVVNKLPVLAGAVQIDIIFNKLSKYLGFNIRTLKSVVWKNLLEIDEEIKLVDIKLPYNEDNLEFLIEAKDSGENVIEICTGKVELNNNSCELQPNLQDYSNDCTTLIKGEEIYEYYSNNGLKYGESYKTVKHVLKGKGKIISYLELEEGIGVHETGISPQILDGAFHSIIADSLDKNQEVIYLPFSTKRIDILRPFENKCYAYIDFIKNDINLIKCNIYIKNLKNEMICKIEEFVVRKIKKNNEVLYFNERWHPQKVVKDNENKNKNTIIFSNTINENIFNFPNENIYYVKFGESYKRISKFKFEIGNKEEDYISLLNEIIAYSFKSLEIVHLWALDNYKDSIDDSILMDISGISLFYLTKAMIKKFNSKEKIKLLYFYFNQYNSTYSYYSAVEGLLKTVKLEKPNFNFRIVELDNSSDVLGVNNLERIKNELLDKTNSQIIRYKSNERYIKKLEKIKISSDNNIFYRGLYVITGGLGGVGFILAKHLLSNKECSVLLIGRSELDYKKREILNNLKKLNKNVEYVKADVSDYQELDKALQEGRKKFGSICGVIHCAGVIKDNFILKKSGSEFTDTIKPKIQGTINLDRLTSDDDLRYFVLFSSITSVLGNIGQSDYGYANSFMDNFVKVRNMLKESGAKSGKSISINWPLWKEGGMLINEKMQDKLFNEKGMTYLENIEGINAFENALMSTYSNVTILVGDERLLSKMIDKENDAVIEVSGTSNKRIDRKNKWRLEKNTQNYFSEILGKQIGVTASEIDINKDFSEYGINSLMIMEMIPEIEKSFGEISKTIFFEFNNITELATYFIENYKEIIQEIFEIEVEVKQEAISEIVEVFEDKKKNSYDHIEETHKLIKEVDDKIAVIGLSGRYPMADNLEEFWNNLSQGRDCITEIPSCRWDYKKYFDSDKENLGTVYSKWGGFLSDIDKFDPLFFNMSPREAEIIDPQERLFLQTAWETIETSGHTREELSAYEVGVYVGVMWGQYQLYGVNDGLKEKPTSSYASIANRVSYTFNLKGPSMAIDTMCSSSITAIKLACDALKKGDIDYAICGGVNIMSHPNKYFLLSQGKFASTDGKCRSFGINGDGYVPGEGVGAVLLKPLKNAVKDKDYIYGVISGYAVNHGGKTNGYTVPSPIVQSNLIKKCLTESNIDPHSISYFEAHGTGTALGDPIEIDGITKAFKEFTSDKQFCPIGSVKSNIGHLEAAAGIAALTKVLLQLKNKMIVPSIHSDILNDKIDFKNSPVYVQRELSEWENVEDKYPRRAAISSFGAGGANGFLLIEEYNNQADNIEKDDDAERIFVLTAKDEASLKEYANRIKLFLEVRTNLRKKTYTKNAEEITINVIKSMISKITGIPYDFISDEGNLEEYFSSESDLLYFIEQINANYNIVINLSSNVNKICIEELSFMISNNHKNQVNSHVGMLEYYDKKSLNLADITYTVQVGRESMGERLAIITSSIEQLINKLDKYINNIDEYGVFVGNIYKKPELLGVIEDFNLEDILKKLYEDNNLESIAKLWVAGTSIDWRKVYDTSKCSYVPLPTYPFKKERYWIDEKTDEKQYSINPLIDSNVSTIYKQAYVKKLTKNDLFIKGHKINNQTIVPGSLLIEIAREAGELCNDYKPVCKIEDIYWLSGANVNEDDLDVEINLIPNENNISYEIYSKANEKLVYSIGTLYYDGLIEDKNIRINEIMDRCTNSLDITDFYKMFDNVKIQYSTQFKNITSIRRNQDEAIVHVSMLNCEDYTDEIKLNPFILDAVFQSVSIFELMDEDNLDRIPLPFSIKEIIIYGSLKNECFVYTKKVNEKYDIFALDDHGKVVIEIKGFALKNLSDNSDINKNGDIVYYKETLIEKQLSDKNTRQEIGNIVVVGGDLETFNKLNKTIKSRNSESMVLYVNDENSATDLFNRILNGELEITHILYNFQTDNTNELKEKMKNLGIKLLRMSKALINISSKIRVIMLFTGQHSQYYTASANAFLKSVINETKKHLYKTISFQSLNQIHDSIINEILSFNKKIEEVIYIDGKRLVKSYDEVKLIKKEENYLFKNNGVYVITGGAGELGLIFAKYLINRGKCSIILVGRSELSKEKQEIIEKLSSEDIYYLRSDISNLDDVRVLYKEIKMRFGRIDGIIHSAGIIKDSFVKNKTEEELNLVMNPKVNGLINLDLVTKDEKLDYFISFSSIAAALGNRGQVDYAFANGFVDSYIEKRNEKVEENKRYGKSVSINWPLWKSGGMNIDKDIVDNMFQELGVVPLETIDGIRAFEEIILSGESRIMVLNGEVDRLREWVLDVYGENENMSAVDEEFLKNSENTVSEEKLLEDIINMVKQIVSETTKVPVSRIKEKENLDAYGIDSIMMLSMGKELGKKMGENLQTIFVEYSNILDLSKYILGKNRIEVKINNEEGKKTHHRFQPLNVPVIKNNIRFRTKSQIVKSESEIERRGVAVIGISGRYPKAENIEEFWGNLKQGKNCIEEIPIDRWDYKLFYNEEQRVASKWGGFIKDVDKFDSLFFSISPKEAAKMDPQERLMLEETWHALEDAGYSKQKLFKLRKEGKRVGVFVGTMYQQYPWLAKDSEYGAILSGTSYWSIANRISYFLNINGPSMVIDTACSSSLSALHLAKESINRGECDIAIVGGVNLSLHPYKYIGLSEEHLLGSSDRSMSLGQGDGYVPGEGVGAVILKSLKMAEDDNDNIYCIIKASGINHGGKSSAYKVPNADELNELIIRTFNEGDIQFNTVSYYELAANGLQLADQIEIEALKKAFDSVKGEGKKCAIGCVKSNIGHLEAASGLSQLTKVILQLKNKELVPSINCEKLNVKIDLSDSYFKIQRRLEKWYNNAAKLPLRAAINSIGAGGSNSVVVIEEYVNKKERKECCFSDEDNCLSLLTFSAKDEERLRIILENTSRYIKANETILLKDICYTLYRREHMEERIAFIVHNKADFIELCDNYLNYNKLDDNVYRGNIYDFDYDEEVCPENNELDLKNIASNWIKGIDCLDMLYSRSEFYNLIDIPAYPFERNRYWINDIKDYKKKKIYSDNENKTLINELKEILSELLDIEVNKIDERKSLDVYGINSIIVFKMINSIEDKYGVRITIREFLENYSLNKISELIEISSKDTEKTYICEQKSQKYDFKYYLENLILSSIEEKNISINDAIDLKRQILETMWKRRDNYE